MRPVPHPLAYWKQAFSSGRLQKYPFSPLYSFPKKGPVFLALLVAEINFQPLEGDKGHGVSVEALAFSVQPTCRTLKPIQIQDTPFSPIFKLLSKHTFGTSR